MILAFAGIGFLSIAVAPLGNWMLRVHETLHGFSKLDHELARSAHLDCETLNALAALNVKLATVKLTCTPGSVATALSIVEAQDLLRASWEASGRLVAAFSRDLPDPCGVPGILRWPEAPEDAVRDERERGGMAVTSASIFGASHWRYESSRVNPL